MCKFLASPTCRSSAELITGEISLAFRHAVEVSLSHLLRSGVLPFMPYKVCLLLVMVGVLIALLASNCNIKGELVYCKVFCRTLYRDIYIHK